MCTRALLALGLLRQHEMRDMAQRLSNCHSYLRHGQPWWVDAWWQLNCDLHLQHALVINVEPQIANNGFYQHLQRYWMAHHVALALLFYAWGGGLCVLGGVCKGQWLPVGRHWAIGYLAHNHGVVHREVLGAAVQGRNVRFTSLITMGECSRTTTIMLTRARQGLDCWHTNGTLVGGYYSWASASAWYGDFAFLVATHLHDPS